MDLGEALKISHGDILTLTFAHGRDSAKRSIDGKSYTVHRLSFYLIGRKQNPRRILGHRPNGT